MLTAQQTAAIKATVPLLNEHGETLARTMYARMFSHNPEVKAYFNPAHQLSGRQQKALSNAVCAYAQHIDNPSALADAVELIAQKHVSLGIAPEHYPIVGENLLAAIREVLGEAATDEVIDAWAAAYGQLADIFIERERQIYAEQAARDGWSGFKPFVVTRREPAADNIVSLYLEPVDGQPLAAHRPGQYVAIQTELPDDDSALRNYSLSNAPGTPYYRISVKREDAPAANAPNGKFSNYAHDQLAVGDHVRLSPPCGEFTLQADDASRPLVLLAGGVGITPLLSMLHAAVETDPRRDIVLIQAVRERRLRPFSDEIDALAAAHDNLRVHVRYSEPAADDPTDSDDASRGLIDHALLDALVGDRPADYYFCGPKPMLALVRRLLDQRRVPDSAMHYEFFGPADGLDEAA
ncbi:NO-inducible flavohemoprotein [Salinisphaera sp. LB1]|uniref:NO-inducible flavohemoprotein n=1 Tax=Salinisphaera sp. LB1 TaxID=2183911 RepID=UPI000D7067CB|nr:NO-inducible flavohemoprotein [Salinisphaera sp. LB1]AWN15150.1 Flavohemoprotein (Hemoglobin-like protein) (Flavohemoglobin) (Nitric oxide dioxygenase) [Salinisphaera sp. LB1]